MSFDLSFAADRVARWATILDLPKSLAAAIDKLEAVEQVEAPGVALDISKLTPKNAETVVSDHAAALAVEAHFNDARRRIVEAAAREVLNVAGGLVDDIRAAILPRFDAAVKTFTEAVNAIGSADLSAAALVAAGPQAVAGYHNAVAAQQEISVLESWVSSLVELPRFGGNGIDPVCRITSPSTRGQLQALENARGRNSELNPLYTTALELGVPLSLNFPDEAGAIRADIQSQPVEKKTVKFARLGGW